MQLPCGIFKLLLDIIKKTHMGLQVRGSSPWSPFSLNYSSKLSLCSWLCLASTLSCHLLILLHILSIFILTFLFGLYIQHFYCPGSSQQLFHVSPLSIYVHCTLSVFSRPFLLGPLTSLNAWCLRDSHDMWVNENFDLYQTIEGHSFKSWDNQLCIWSCFLPPSPLGDLSCL